MKRSYLAAVVAIASGAIVLFSFIFPTAGIQTIRGFLLELVIWLAAVAFFDCNWQDHALSYQSDPTKKSFLNLFSYFCVDDVGGFQRDDVLGFS